MQDWTLKDEIAGVNIADWSMSDGFCQKAKKIVILLTRMWADAQRDGRPAEYQWRPLFNAEKRPVSPPVGCYHPYPPPPFIIIT